MTHEQLLLLKLMEECAEVAHRASKYIQFGGGDVQAGHTDTNRERLWGEIKDFLSTLVLLHGECIIPYPNPDELKQHAEMKKAKILKYKAYSQTLGRVEGDRLA